MPRRIKMTAVETERMRTEVNTVEDQIDTTTSIKALGTTTGPKILRLLKKQI